MSEAKKKVAKLGQDKMEDVKGGIPYEDPTIIPLDGVTVTVPPGEDPTVTVTPPTGEDPATTTTIDTGCVEGHRNQRSCFTGHGALYACSVGISINQP
jgi:hypothetical protein